MKKIFIVFFVVSFLFSCGSHGSSSPDTTGAPSISNLFFSPSSVPVGTGGGATTIIGTFDFIDNDSDISSSTIVATCTPTGSGTLTGPVNLNGYTSGNLTITVTGADTTTAKTCIFDFYVTDTSGLNSNHLSGTWAVT